MILDRFSSWYVFIFSKDYFASPSDPGSYIMYNNKRLTNKEYLEHWGKWVFFVKQENVKEMANKLDPYVENKSIPCIKYDRKPQQWFEMEECVFCVYCDDRQRDEVWKILERQGAKGRAWSYEREVISKWMPGGLHMERWLKHHNTSEEEAEKIRKDAKKKFDEKFHDNPDGLCMGWEQ